MTNLKWLIFPVTHPTEYKYTEYEYEIYPGPL